MPFDSIAELPADVRDRLTPKQQRRWLAVWNSVFEETGDESRAFAAANSVTSKKQAPKRFPPEGPAFTLLDASDLEDDDVLDAFVERLLGEEDAAEA